MTSVPAGRPEDGPSRSEEDRRLLIRYHRHGDQAAREQLVQRLLPLARRMARRYRRSDEPLDDLIQVATLGLIKAIDRFDPSRETAFSSYAVPTMLGELKRYFRDNGWAVHVPRGMQERVMQVDNAVKDLSRKIGRSPSAAEVSEHLGLTTEQVLEAMEAASAYDAVSLEAYRFGDEGDGETYAESIGVEDERFELVEYGATIAPTLQALPARDRIVLHLRFAEDMTQAEIAERVGVSQMHVSRLIRRALERLRTVAEHSGVGPPSSASGAWREKRQASPMRRPGSSPRSASSRIADSSTSRSSARLGRVQDLGDRGRAEVVVADDRGGGAEVGGDATGAGGAAAARQLAQGGDARRRSRGSHVALDEPADQVLSCGPGRRRRRARGGRLARWLRRTNSAERSGIARISFQISRVASGPRRRGTDLEPDVGGALAHAPASPRAGRRGAGPSRRRCSAPASSRSWPLAVALVDHLARDEAAPCPRQGQRDRPFGAELHAVGDQFGDHELQILEHFRREDLIEDLQRRPRLRGRFVGGWELEAELHSGARRSVHPIGIDIRDPG